MCFLTFTKSSSGLSGCQCCMIYVEHVFHPLRKGHVLFEKCIQTVLRALVLCLYIKPQHLLFDQQISVTQGEFSDARKHLVTIVMLPLSFPRKLAGLAVWTAAALFLCIFSPSLILTHVFHHLSEYYFSVKTHSHVIFFIYIFLDSS